MNSSSGLIDAIENVRTQVRAKGRFHAQKTPAALLATLFRRLTEAVQKDSLEGMPLERREAEKLLLHDNEYDIPGHFESAWKTAVTAIRDAMNAVRDPLAPAPGQPDVGMACIRFPIDHVKSLVIVEGPRINGDSYLQLRVRTIPVAEFTDEPAAGLTASPLPHVPSLPARVDERLKRISEQVTRVLDDCDDDERRRSLITQHVLMVVKELEDAALQLGLGEIHTQYNDFALLSAQVEAMQNGDALLGLTEWKTDWQWWESDEGRRFRDANETAVTQGAVIRRIFLHAEDERSADRRRRRREMQMHRDMGVEVMAISIRQVRQFRPAAVNVRSRCVLWSSDDVDGWLTYSVVTSVDGRPEGNRLSVHPDDVKENRSLLEEIWSHAHE